jgi:SAM-dependent methyltransferase
MKLNIGGGPHFKHPGWINLDAETGFHFTPTRKFDIPSRSIDLVYSSHCLEHLDDATVQHVLNEAWRVLLKHGRLVIKIPNFDDVLRRRKVHDASYFINPIWGFDSVAYSWFRKNVPDNIDTRCSMIFCGFWNKAWGNHFGQRPPDDGTAYHGPACFLTDNGLQAVLALNDPHSIAAHLSSSVRENEKDYTFNHQNAWSHIQFVNLLTLSGFRVMEGTTSAIVDDNIPGCLDMESISSYYAAVPA